MSFHVPERWRLVQGPISSAPYAGQFGAFLIDSCEPGWQLAMIADDGTHAEVPESLGWEHVSVSARSERRRQTRVPTWREMCLVKELFWDDEDVVMQLHPRRSLYVNQHPHVLHLWRSTTQPIPEPPPALVGYWPK